MTRRVSPKRNVDHRAQSARDKSQRSGLVGANRESCSIAIYAAVSTGLDSKVTKAAAGTRDTNSVDLSKAFGSVHGSDAENSEAKVVRMAF